MAKKTTEELMRDRLAELQAERDQIDAEAAPIQSQIDALIAEENDLKARMAQKVEMMKPYKERRGALENEIGKLARGLGGKSTSGE